MAVCNSGTSRMPLSQAAVSKRSLPCAVAAGEPQGEILLLAAEKAYAEPPVGKHCVVRFRACIDADQQARRIHAERGDGADRQPTPTGIHPRCDDGDAARKRLLPDTNNTDGCSDCCREVLRVLSMWRENFPGRPGIELWT